MILVNYKKSSQLLEVITNRYLAERLKRELGPPASRSTGRLGAFHAVGIHFFNQPLVLCVSENGNLPVILKTHPTNDFALRLPLAVKEMLEHLSIPANVIESEIAHMQEVEFVNSADSALIEVLKEYRKELDISLKFDENPPVNWVEASKFLARGIYISREEKNPAEHVRKLFSGRHLTLVE